MTKTLSTLLLLALAGTAALAAPRRSAAPKKHVPPVAPAVPAPPPVLSVTPAAHANAAHPLDIRPATANEVTLYDGKAAGPTTPSVADWGGGSGKDSTETYLFGGHSLKVTMLDMFQGARITFPTPVSLAGDNRVFQMTLRRGGATLHYDPQTTSPLPPGETTADAPGQFQGGFQGDRNNRRRGRRGQNQGGATVIPPITDLRLSFTFADGRQSDILRPVPAESDAVAGEGWYSVNVPVAALKLGAGADPLLKSVTVGGNQYGVFFVGRIKLGTDTPTLAVTIDGLDAVLPGQPVTLTAKGGSAFSALKYAWDLDEGNGVPDQPTGETATARYFEGGQDHTVTLTVTDLDGAKSPITVTKVIHVKGQGNGLGNQFGNPPGGGPGRFPGGGPGPTQGNGPGGVPGNGAGIPPEGRQQE